MAGMQLVDAMDEETWRWLYAQRKSLTPGSPEWLALAAGANKYNPRAAGYRGRYQSTPPEGVPYKFPDGRTGPPGPWLALAARSRTRNSSGQTFYGRNPELVRMQEEARQRAAAEEARLRAEAQKNTQDIGKKDQMTTGVYTPEQAAADAAAKAEYEKAKADEAARGTATNAATTETSQRARMSWQERFGNGRR